MLSQKTFEDLQESGFFPYDLKIPDHIGKMGPSCIHGVVLPDGTYIWCPYMGHRHLMPKLNSLNLTNDDELDYNETIKISSGEIIGLGIAGLSTGRSDNITTKQMNFLWNNRDYLLGESVGFDTNNVTNIFKDFYAWKEDFGGKYNNLIFLKNCYPELNIPYISKKFFKGSSIRTSPEYSLPGVLDSYFNIQSKKESEKIKRKIRNKFNQYKELIPKNKLHLFHQEFIEGMNGVAHYKDGVFTYSVSSKQGDIVMGKKSNDELSPQVTNELISICEKLSYDLESNIQIEFVVTPKNEVYIVQLREFFNENIQPDIDTNDALVVGYPFSTGSVSIKKDELLVVDEDAHSESLVDKKALVVKSDVEFSHILALARALNIPAFYNVNLDENTLNENIEVSVNKDVGLIKNL
jgi:hypothetical protein